MDHCVCAGGAVLNKIFDMTAVFVIVRAAWLGRLTWCSRGPQIGLSGRLRVRVLGWWWRIRMDSGADFKQAAGPVNVEQHAWLLNMEGASMRPLCGL